MNTLSEIESGKDHELKELASLARLVTFARLRAKELNVQFPTYCLDLALGAIIQEMNKDDGEFDYNDNFQKQWLGSIQH